MLRTFKPTYLVVAILLTLTATDLYGQDAHLITITELMAEESKVASFSHNREYLAIEQPRQIMLYGARVLPARSAIVLEDFAVRALAEYPAGISRYENSKTSISEHLNGTAAMGLQIPNKPLLDAGRDLKISAVSRYVGFGLGLVGFTNASRSLSYLDFSSRTLALGGITLKLASSNLVTPFFIGQAGKKLTKAYPEGPIQEAGIALQKYRKYYYGGYLSSMTGSGILAWGIAKDSNSCIATGAIVTIASVLYTALAPPYYLGSAGSSLCKAEGLSMGVNLHMQKASQYLKTARQNQYSALIISALGGIIAVCSIARDDDIGIYGAGCALGLAAVCDLVSSTRVHAAGIELNKAARAMQ